ncbi:MAG TPA: ATP-dependent DNA helicase RecG [Candidatus Saccharimonadia bacterium]|nr:ATP-dependent DNA helicase RecG [Candidatus Saccharimonadia bacterium]
MSVSLNDSITSLPGVGDKTAQNLALLDIVTIRDLLYHTPFRYDDFSNVTMIGDAPVDENAAIQAEVHSITSFTGRRHQRIVKAVIFDATGKMDVTWFGQPYMLMSLRKGMVKRFSGKIKLFNKKKSMSNPTVEDGMVEDSIHSGRLVPIYPVTESVTSRVLRSAVAKAFASIPVFDDPLTSALRSQHHLLDLKTSLYRLHFPEQLDEISEARRRMAFEEVYSLLRAAKTRQQGLQLIKVPQMLTVSALQQKAFERALPFELSVSQVRAILDLALDLVQKHPTNRLIQGEVGSGKTVVAAFALYIAALNSATGLFVAPTQIVAQQHFTTLHPIFEKLKIPLELVTSQTENDGKLAPNTIYIGTHALFEKKRRLHPTVVVIDEEHRFGVAQRETFWQRAAKKPHLISMTATPIPRTVALTVLADREVSYLEEIPTLKKQVTTSVVTEAKRKDAYNWMLDQIETNSAQIFIVCPFIQQSDHFELNLVKSAEDEFVKIKKLFPKQRISMIHGKIPQETRAKILDSMHAGKLDILVSTPIIEVGIDMPRASIIMIEGAERFGLAQLHQLRGRVGRAGQKAYCLLVPSENIEGVTKRLQLMVKNSNGSELAELDLALRGSGEFFGTRQSGWDTLKFATWSDHKLIQECKAAAEAEQSS